MCCIFNFMQYLFSFLHKAITAMLTCVIVYAVCCVMLFAVTAGVALGYNYSVSEYMEHKDTNVSVQLQRGIFSEKGEGGGGGGGASRRSGGDGGEIGEEPDSGYINPKSSLRSHIQQLDAAENYERKLDELTSENYQNFQPIINYGTVNLDQLSTHKPHASTASSRNLRPASYADEATTENFDTKKESIEMMKALIGRLKGARAKDVMTIIGEEVAKKAIDKMDQNVSNYRMPVELAMAVTASSTTEELDVGLDIAPLGIEISSSSKEILFSEYTTPASVASSALHGFLSDTDDGELSSDWKKKLYAAAARIKRKDTQMPIKNKHNTRTKEAFMKSLFQDPSFAVGIKFIDLVPNSIIKNEISNQNGGLDQLKTNINKDEKDKHLKSQSEAHVHKKIDRTTSRRRTEVNDSNADLHDDDGLVPSDEEYDYTDDEKPGQITVRKKRNAPHLLVKHFNQSRILTTLIKAIS